MRQRTRLAVDSIRAILRSYTSDERAEILRIVERGDSAPAVIDLDAIERALENSGGHIGRAADALGCSRRTLQNRMREHDMPARQAGRKRL